MGPKTVIFLGLILVAAGLTAWDLTRTPQTDSPGISESPPPRSATVPDFVLNGLSGEKFRLSDMRGRVVLIHFWASWCAPCLEEFPALLNLAAAMKNEIRIIAVTVDKTQGAAKRFLTRLPKESRDHLDLPSFRLVHDPDQVIAFERFQTVRYPETFIIGPAGYMRREITGPAQWGHPEMREYLGRIARTGSGREGSRP
mgnify:CR=1 FL=1